MFVPVAALSGGERPGYFRQPARASGSGFVFFGQSAEPAALAAGTGIAGGTTGFGQAARRKMEGRLGHQAAGRRAMWNPFSAICRSALPEIIAELKSVSRESYFHFQALSQSGRALRRVRIGGRVGRSIRVQGRVPVAGKRRQRLREMRGVPLPNAWKRWLGAKEAEVTRLRAALQSAQASTPAPASQENCRG